VGVFVCVCVCVCVCVYVCVCVSVCVLYGLSIYMYTYDVGEEVGGRWGMRPQASVCWVMTQHKQACVGS